jgi:glycosyltransferase involved in cell wall biosynthesis
MKINLYYWNNGVGVVTDAILLNQLLNVNYDVIVYDVSKPNDYRKSDLGIFIQNIWADYLNHNAKNVYIINEEWLTKEEISYLDQFDYLIVKSKYAKQLLNSYHKHIINTGFFSLNKYNNPNFTGNILHFKGKSIQKNHELAYKYKHQYNINIVDSEVTYLSNQEIINTLNNHDIHICCSLYEAWGHYIWEAMSCGKLVVCSEIPVFKEYMNPDLVKFVPIKETIKYNREYRFLNDANQYRFREGFFIDENIFINILNEKNKLLEFQKQNCKEIVKFTESILCNNKIEFLKLIKNII